MKTTNDILQHNYWPLSQTITTNNTNKNPNPSFQDGERFNLSANDPIFWSPRPQKRRRNQKGRIWGTKTQQAELIMPCHQQPGNLSISSNHPTLMCPSLVNNLQLWFSSIFCQMKFFDPRDTFLVLESSFLKRVTPKIQQTKIIVTKI